MSFRTQDPFSGELLETYEYATKENVQNSIELLGSSFSGWSRLPVPARQKLLVRLAFRIQEKAETIARLITAEMGKPLAESRLEVAKCIQTIERACEYDLSFLEPKKLHSPKGSAVVKRQACGVIYSIMPWNYPLWQAIRMAVPALLAGNTILLKHSEITPKMGFMLQELFEGIFETPLLVNNLIAHDLTDFVLQNPEIGGVSLTGSVKAGQMVSQIAARYFKKAVLELGGSDPYIVCPDADLQLAATKIAAGRLLNCGQSCIAVKRVIVQRAVLQDLLPLLMTEFEQYPPLGPLAHPKFKVALTAQLRELKINTSAESVYMKTGEYINAEIYLLEKNSTWLSDQEFFAPILLVIPYETIDEAIEIANSTEFGLAAGVFSRDLMNAESISERIEAGQVAINDFFVTDISLPFGGIKKSGIGRELGTESYLEFTRTKVVTGI